MRTMARIRVDVVDHNDNGTTYTRTYRVVYGALPITQSRAHERCRDGLLRLLDLGDHRLTVTTTTLEDD